MSIKTFRILQATLMIGLAIFIISKWLLGGLDNYIASRFDPLVLSGAGLLLLLGGLSYREFQKEKAHELQHLHEQEQPHEHDGHTHRPNAWLLTALLVPLLLGVLTPSGSLSADAIFTRGINENLGTGIDPMQLPQLSTERSVLDWVRAYNYSPDISTFGGEAADVIGFVYRDTRLKENQFLLARFTISCCVADAFAIGVIVESDSAARFPENTWVRVQGTMTGTYAEGQQIPLMQADTILEVPEPENPYLYN
ncbi:MAG TPA: TIGR03943 family protein [Anaerolineales bacterium]|nr:TIGR03943 family protein [Anaerolineales bacterium]